MIQNTVLFANFILEKSVGRFCLLFFYIVMADYAGIWFYYSLNCLDFERLHSLLRYKSR